jgi:hypothetical protein
MPKEVKKGGSEKKPLQPYMKYAQEIRKVILQENEGIKAKEVMKKVGERWRALDESVKKDMQEKYEKEKEEYQKTHPEDKEGKKMKPKKIVEAKPKSGKKPKTSAVVLS